MSKPAYPADPFFEFALDMLCVAGFDGYFKRLNGQWHRILGYDLEALMAQPFIDFVHPDDRDMTLIEAGRLATGVQTVRFENRYRHCDGSYRWLLWSASPDTDNGLIYATARDITGEKQAAADLRLANQDASDQTRRIHALHTIASRHDLSLAEQMQQTLMLGCELLDLEIGIASHIDEDTYRIEAVWAPGFELTTGQQFDLADTYCSVVAQSDAVQSFEKASESAWREHPCYVKMQLETYIGTPIHANGAIYGTLNFSRPTPRPVPFREVDREFVQLLGDWIGLTIERLQIAEQDRQHVAELNRSNKELDHFAYIVSHDLKEPLRGIKTYAEGLVRQHGTALAEDGRNKLHTLVDQTQRMHDLMDNLLYYSRLGRTQLAIGEVALDEVVDEVVASLHIVCQEKNAELRRDGPLPTLHCDRARVAEIFRNLVSNALKYNDKERPLIRIGCQGGEPPRLYVRDNGIGIRPRHLEDIFQIFRRLHGRDQYGGGTGSGLTIARRIVDNHGGRLWAESLYGEGSTFYFTLAPQTGADGKTASKAIGDSATSATSAT